MIRSTSEKAIQSDFSTFVSFELAELKESRDFVFLPSSSAGTLGVTGGDCGAGGTIDIGCRRVLLEVERDSLPSGLTRLVPFPNEEDPARFACGGGCCEGAIQETLLGIFQCQFMSIQPSTICSIPPLPP